MAAIITKSLSIMAAEQIYKSVPTANLYLVIGRTAAWNANDTPNAVSNTITHTNDFWQHAYAAKKITANDLRLAVRRIDWTANTVYDMYRHDDEGLYGKNFYVVTDEYNVYKCLYNNFGANSTSKPTYTTPDAKSTESDGYIWKYLYTVPTTDRVRFLTDDWLPIRTLTVDNGDTQWIVQESAVYGAIDIVELKTVGNGYWNTASVNVAVAGDGADFSAIVTSNTANGNSLSQIIVLNPGTGYTYATVNISGGGSQFGSNGQGATANAIISPYGGHGFDPVEELGASTIIVSAKLQGSESNTFSVVNDFRQIALVKDPISAFTGNVVSNTYFTQSRDCTLVGVGTDYQIDEIVYQGGGLANATFLGTVLDWNSVTNVLRLTNTRGAPSAKRLVGATSFSERFLLTSKIPDVVIGSGKILYKEDRAPISRSADQTEEFKIIIKF